VTILVAPARRQAYPGPSHCWEIVPRLLVGERMPYGRFIGV
jgi:hypothetical protein